jgi:hypothetical protein
MERVLSFLNLNNKEDMSEELIPQKSPELENSADLVQQEQLVSQGERTEQEVKSFEEIAKDVIRDSIRSAICIDDTYASAYSTEEGLNTAEPKKLYESFREIGKCDLDIYQFKDLEKSWNKEYMLFNKDLMILDWELNQSSIPKYSDSIVILSDVIKSNQIPFVVIYTNTEDIHEVGKALISEYNLVNKDFDRDGLIKDLNSKFVHLSKDKEVEFDLFLEDLECIQLCYDYINLRGKNDEIKSLLMSKLKTHLSIKENIQDKAICSKITSAFKILGLEKNDSLTNLSILALNKNHDKLEKFDLSRIDSVNLLYKIDSTTVLIYHKKDQENGIEPEGLFEEFSKAIISNPHNYLSLLSLELKDQLREEFSKIGTQFTSIDEIAFFYHMQNFKSDKGFNKKGIYDFILNSWMQDVNAHKLDGTSKVVDLIDEAFARKETEIPKELEVSLVGSLVKYSAFISSLQWKTTNRKLRFGDVFRMKESTDYFICITPHCDCEESESKINNNFYFIKGAVTNHEAAIRNAEQGYYSFLNIKNEAVCIDWSCKPFTVYINDNNVDLLTFRYKDKLIDLEGIASLKENFAQRLANESFGYGFRVGIGLPHANSVDQLKACVIC